MGHLRDREATAPVAVSPMKPTPAAAAAERAAILKEMVSVQAALVRAKERALFYGLFPDGGPLRRDLYPRHTEFFAAGKTYRERCAICANRVGKTLSMGGYETACHLTGLYPTWWPGRRVTRPIRAWAAGATNETTRDIIQRTLLGSVTGSGSSKSVDGTGVIPGDCLGNLTWKAGVSDLVDTVQVRHVSGNHSILGLKSYQQGRKSFEGTAQDLVWLDEEPPMDVYGECLIRTATTDGMVICTFTPMEGLSDVALMFMPQGGVTQ